MKPPPAVALAPPRSPAAASLSSMVTRAAIVYNPVNMPLQQVRRVVEEQEQRHGWETSVWFETSREDPGRQAARRALASDPAVVIVAGGDGTVRAAGEALSGSDTPVALVPLGTGNLLARNLGLPLGDVAQSVTTAFTGSTRRIDVGRADIEYPNGDRSTHTFLVMAGIGLDASMAKETSASAKRRLGWAAYVFPIARSILANRKFALRYRVDDGQVRSTHAHTVIVGNCGTLTGNMLLLPNARVDDGLLDVVLLRPKGRFEWARIGTRLTVQRIARRSQLGREVLTNTAELRALAYSQGKRFEVRFDVPHEAQLDGDTLGQIVAARLTIDPGRLNVLVGHRP